MLHMWQSTAYAPYTAVWICIFFFIFSSFVAFTIIIIQNEEYFNDIYIPILEKTIYFFEKMW